MYSHDKQSNRQTGIALLEGLIAILIFSLGILAIVGMQAIAVKQSTDARYRSDAALLADQLISTMWVDDHTTLTTKYQTGGTGYTSWLSDVSAALPKVADNPPTVDVTSGGDVTITIYWLSPSEPSTSTPHKYISSAHIE